VVQSGGEVPELHYTNLLIVVAAAMAAPLAVELLPVPKVPPVVVELGAGILIGSTVLGIAHVDEPVTVLSQVGLVFLFFIAGLEIAFDRHSERHLRLVALAFAISLAFAIGCAALFRAARLAEAPLFVGIVLAATSFGIVVAVLKDAGETRTPFGQLVITSASVADFATVVLLSLFFSQNGSGVKSTVILLGLFTLLAAAMTLGIYRARLSPRLAAAVLRLQETTAQIGVRIAFVLLIAFVALAQEFGFEVVLGAFLAGAIISLVDHGKAVESSGLKRKLEAIGFGVFIPVFFVTSGMQLKLGDLFDSAADAALVPATVAALLVARGLPAVLYRRFVPRAKLPAIGLLQATSLTFMVAGSQIGVQLGKISGQTAAGLVTAGVISVLVFPALALSVLARTGDEVGAR
jgi:Kef-type K+ transport system membrane component KefB